MNCFIGEAPYWQQLISPRGFVPYWLKRIAGIMKPGAFIFWIWIEQGFGPEISIIDSAKGLTKGFEEVLPKTAIRHDHFHIIMDLKDCGKFLSNKEASAVTVALKLLKRADKARNEEKKQTLMEAWNAALIDLNMREETCKIELLHNLRN